MWIALSVALAANPGDRPIDDGCSDLRDPTALDDAIRGADQAIDALDPEALRLASDQLEQAVRCRTATVEVRQAAHLHRVLGVVAFVGGDEPGSARWFAASRALDPAAPLGHAIGGPLQAAWERAVPGTPPERTDLPDPPRRAELVVDGQRLTTRPTHLPFVLQLVDGDGAVLHGGIQPAGEALPAWLAPPEQAASPERTRRPPRFTLLAAGTGLLSVGALSGAAVTRARYNDLQRYDEDVEGLIPVNRALGRAGVGLGVGALGLGAVAMFAGEW